jgi:hypothetical protein
MPDVERIETDAERMDRERLEAWARVADGSLPFEVKKCALCKDLKAIPKGRENCASCRHPLVPEDLRRMNVPEEFWRVTVPAATESTQVALRNYLANFDEFVARGAGMYLWGEPGRGKTGAAVALLKAARERFKTCFFIRAGEFREALQHQHDFDADTSMLDRVRDVEVLVIDSYSATDLKLPYLKLEDLMERVAARGSHRKVTFITSTVSPPLLMQAGPFFETVGTYIVPVPVTGKNRRAEEQATLAKKMLTAPEEKPETPEKSADKSKSAKRGK